MKFNKRWAILLAGGAVIALIVVIVIAQMNAGRATTASTFDTATIRRGTLVATVNATGAISPLREAQLAFSVTGPLAKLDVKQGDLVKAGQLLAQLDTRALDLQLAQAEANLVAAQAKFDQLKSPAPADVAAAQSAVASAEAALAQLKNPTPNDMTIAKSDLDKAAAAVARAQADYDRIGGASNPFIALTPQALALQQATLDYQKIAAIYNSKINPTESQVKQAQTAVEQARAQLARLTNPSANDLKSAQASVDQMRAARDLAQARIADALIRAPFDGLVTRVDFDLGSFIPAGRALIAVADISELRVKLNIDETDIARVQTGQEVTIGLDAYPDATLQARVSDVAATATTVQGVVNYVVTVTINPGTVPVKIGMTANANVVVARKENVLLVPNRAVRASSSKRFVTIQNPDGTTKEIEVKLGMANDLETEVVSGLNEGQSVIVSFTQASPIGGPFGGTR